MRDRRNASDRSEMELSLEVEIRGRTWDGSGLGSGIPSSAR